MIIPSEQISYSDVRSSVMLSGCRICWTVMKMTESQVEDTVLKTNDVKGWWRLRLMKGSHRPRTLQVITDVTNPQTRAFFDIIVSGNRTGEKTHSRL
jgi:hypothetical protein